MFLLRGQDQLAPGLVRLWAEQYRQLAGYDPGSSATAPRCLTCIRSYRQS